MVFGSVTPKGKFVAWGDKKAKGKENPYLVKAGKDLTGRIQQIKDSETYGKIFEIKVKEEVEPVIVVGTTVLLREMGWVKDQETGELTTIPDVKPPNVGDVIKIIFKGMVKTKHGEAYDFEVLVDR